MDEKYTLLVIDEDPSFYDDLFFDGWVKKGVNRNKESGNIDVDNVSSALEQRDYDAILVEVKWLNSNKNDFIKKLRGVGKPFVVLSRMTETESRRHEPVGVWALRHGASGVIDISSSDKKEELTSIIKQFIPKSADIGYLEYGGNLDDFKVVVNFLLSQPTICFRHYPFYGKTCDDGIFGEGVLDALSEYSAKVLCDALRYAILEAVLDVRKPDSELKVIEKRHLWKRLSVDGAKEVDDDHVFLFCVNNALGAQKTLDIIAKDFDTTEDKLKERLREIRKRKGGGLSKTAHKHIFKCSLLHVFFIYHPNSKYEAKKAIRQIEALRSSDELRFQDYHEDISPGENEEQAIQKMADIADIAVMLLCPDLLIQPLQEEPDWVRSLFDKHQQNKMLLVPLILKPCLWYFNERLNGLQVLPRSKTALFERPDQPESNLLEVVIDIKNTAIDEIWMKKAPA